VVHVEAVDACVVMGEGGTSPKMEKFCAAFPGRRGENGAGECLCLEMARAVDPVSFEHAVKIASVSMPAPPSGHSRERR
jgi:hypothetical protein